ALFCFTRLALIPYDSNEARQWHCCARKCTRENQVRLVRRREMATATKMTQAQFIKTLAADVDLPAKTVKDVVNAYSELAVKETKKSGMCVLPGIGRLVRVERKARMGRNPQTGEAIKIAA